MGELLQTNHFFIESRHIRGRYCGRILFKMSFYEVMSTKITKNMALKNRPDIGFSSNV